MALKYGSKSGGFGLRSGNKKGMPFKEMGSSPAKDLSSVMGSFDFKTQGDIDQEKKLQTSIESQPKIKTYKIDESKTEPVSTEAKIKIKDTGKTTSLSSRPSGEDPVTKTPSPKETKTTEKKDNWFKRTLEKGKELQTKLIGEEGSEKRARYKDRMAHLTNVAARMGDLDQPDVATDNLEKLQASKQSAEAHRMKMENFERNALQTDQLNTLRQHKIDLLKKSEAGESEVPETKDYGGGTDPVLTTTLEDRKYGRDYLEEEE